MPTPYELPAFAATPQDAINGRLTITVYPTPDPIRAARTLLSSSNQDPCIGQVKFSFQLKANTLDELKGKLQRITTCMT